MRIWPHYEKRTTAIDELSLSEIDSMIEVLQSLKAKGTHARECYKEAVAAYNASGSTAVGPMGYFPPNEPKLARATMEYYDHWTSSTMTLQLSTKVANELGDVVINDEQLNLDMSAIWNEVSQEINMDTFEETLSESIASMKQHNKEYSHREVLSAIMASEEGEGDESTQYIKFGTWYPCGGVFVTKALGRCYICEHNIKGLEIKEVSEAFYNAFVKEFGVNQ